MGFTPGLLSSMIILTFVVLLTVQLCKSTQNGASEKGAGRGWLQQRGQNDYLAFPHYLSRCLRHTNPLIHCYISRTSVRCRFAESFCTQRHLLHKHCLVSVVHQNTLLYEFRYSLLYRNEKLCGCLTIERRVREGIVNVSNQRVRHKLGVVTWRSLCLENLMA